jgi:hypothetical protein
MSRRRIFGRRANVAVVTAAIALLANAAGARADELSNLRANSKLLQQRLDEINRAPVGHAAADASNNGGSADAATAMGTIRGSFPRSYLIPGTNTSISVGGSVSESLGWRIGGRSGKAW